MRILCRPLPPQRLPWSDKSRTSLLAATPLPAAARARDRQRCRTVVLSAASRTDSAMRFALVSECLALLTHHSVALFAWDHVPPRRRGVNRTAYRRSSRG